MNTQLELFTEECEIEQKVQAILARRRAYCCSGIKGEDLNLIRAALIAKKANIA